MQSQTNVAEENILYSRKLEGVAGRAKNLAEEITFYSEAKVLNIHPKTKETVGQANHSKPTNNCDSYFKKPDSCLFILSQRRHIKLKKEIELVA